MNITAKNNEIIFREVFFLLVLFTVYINDNVMWYFNQEECFEIRD